MISENIRRANTIGIIWYIVGLWLKPLLLTNPLSFLIYSFADFYGKGNFFI